MKTLLAIALFAAACALKMPRFMAGASGRPGFQEYLTEMGSNAARIEFSWSYIERTLHGPLPNITVASLRANPSAIRDWVGTVDWSDFDRRLSVIGDLFPISAVSEGTKHVLPQFNGNYADPNYIGEQMYLALQYRYVRGTCMRYKDKIKVWQIENELNEAYLEALGGIRVSKKKKGDGHGIFPNVGSWGNPSFTTELLQVLRWAIKDEDPSAVVVSNMHTMVPRCAHRWMGTRHWTEALSGWTSLLDVVALDTYPNYIAASPVLGSRVGDDVREARKIVKDEKPVWVMEVGYPRLSKPISGPDVANFSPERQAEFFASAFDSTVAAGGTGFLVFGVWTDTGIIPPASGFSSKDQKAMEYSMEAQVDDDCGRLIEFVVGHPLYCKDNLATLLDRDHAWNLIAEDGTPGPALAVLKTRFQNVTMA